MWEYSNPEKDSEYDPEDDIKVCLLKVFHPHTIIRRASGAAVKNLMLQPKFKNGDDLRRCVSVPGYANARELALIQNALVWKKEHFEEDCPCAVPRKSRQKKRSRRRSRTRARRKNDGIQKESVSENAAEKNSPSSKTDSSRTADSLSHAESREDVSASQV